MTDRQPDDSEMTEANQIFLDRPNVAGVARDRSGGIAILVEADDAEIRRFVEIWARDKPFAVTVRAVGKIAIGVDRKGEKP